MSKQEVKPIEKNGGVDVDAIIEQKKKREEEEDKPRLDFLKAEERRNNNWKSYEIDKVAYALMKVQEELEGVSKNQANTFYGKNGKPTYADLHQVQQTVYPIMTKHGLSVSQGNQVIQGAVVVTTLLMHFSGQWLRSEIKLPLEKGKITAQGVGGAVTYGRRYGLSAIIGTAQYDADGNDA